MGRTVYPRPRTQAGRGSTATLKVHRPATPSTPISPARCAKARAAPKDAAKLRSRPAGASTRGAGVSKLVQRPPVTRVAPAIIDPPARRRARGGGANLRDVAREAGVSVATVSLVLNGSPRISASTRDRVRGVMGDLGYQPNRLAQSLSGKYVKAVAAILPDLRHAFADGYFGELLRGLTDAASARGFKVFLEQATGEFTAAGRHVELFDRRYVDGVLLLGHTDNSRYAADFADGGYPAVVVDNALPFGDLGSVASDYAGGARQAMDYLRQLGHDRIGLIEAAPELATARAITAAWRDATGGDPALVADGRFTEQGGAEATAAVLDRGRGVTAFLAMSDKMAIGCTHLLRQRGVDVPRDISVIGFDDLPHAAFVSPPLTTIHLPLYDVGRRSCDRLIDRVEGKIETVSETLRTHLVVRDSTAPAGRGEP